MHAGEHIFFYDSGKNWWSRVGKPQNMPVGEIGGPDSEVFYDFETPHDTQYGEHCHPNCDCGRFLEVGNSVFMEYIKTEKGFEKLPQQNVDFGGGLERIAAASLGNSDVFKIDLLSVVIAQLETLSGKKYEENKVAFRVVTDHIRGAVFMIGDNILPSNSEQGYFVRRLLRRAVRFADVIGIPEGKLKNLAESTISMYSAHYNNLETKKSHIMDAIADEETQFRKTLEQGLKQFNRISLRIDLPSQDHKDEIYTTPVQVNGTVRYIPKNANVEGVRQISGRNAFELFTTYGFPIELTEEIAHERGLTVDTKTFKTLMEEHRELSRKGAEHKFKGGLADHSEKVVMYHTATHLLLAALRNELGDHVHQAGSNITGERMRFDFTHGDKVSPEILARVETFVNNAIKNSAQVSIDTMPKAIAEKDPTIEGSFWERYPDEVKVYTITGSDGIIYSRELCGGPHMEETGAITGVFKIVKEESSSAGVRRIKAVLA
jgi:alanyl-tRNA synthetase